MSPSNATAEKVRERDARLGFRVDAKTKRLLERAVRLSRRTLTDYWLMALTDAARRTRVLGYFTLCALGVAPGTAPGAARKHLPRYAQVSATLIGRLAINESIHGRGLEA